MSSIGGYPVYSIEGHVPLATQTAETIQRPGVDGYDIRITGVRSSTSELLVKAGYPTPALRNAAVLAFRALVNSGVVTIVDDQGVTWHNILITGMTVERRHNFLHATDATLLFWLEMRLTVQSLAVFY